MSFCWLIDRIFLTKKKGNKIFKKKNLFDIRHILHRKTVVCIEGSHVEFIHFVVFFSLLNKMARNAPQNWKAVGFFLSKYPIHATFNNSM